MLLKERLHEAGYLKSEIEKLMSELGDDFYALIEGPKYWVVDSHVTFFAVCKATGDVEWSIERINHYEEVELPFEEFVRRVKNDQKR